ncbi:hypothetical protein BDZ97DRAFT_1650235 [Flammula alnicola]|nr:hypothetical protein BDZ97DRAFT_1650235 [Flammula alnicola]
MQDLPYDVWWHITTFLSSDQIKGLLTVNRLLFGIAMDERYRTSLIGSLFHPDTLRSLKRLVDPDVALRVRTFIFKPGHICKLLQESTLEKSDAKVSNTLKKMRRSDGGSSSNSRMRMPIKTPPMAPEVALSHLVQLMGQMTSLATFQVEIRGEEHWYFQETATTFFALGWSTFGRNLQTLDLRVPLEDMAKVLPDPGQGTLGNLEMLSLRIIRASLGTNHNEVILGTILPFIHAHRQTLRSLTLDVAEQTNLSPLLLSLGLPSVTHLKLKQPFVSQEETDYTGLQRFFKAHRMYLTRFDIEIISIFTHFPAPYAFFSQECFTVALPRLLHLSIHAHHFTEEYTGGILPYIHQFKSTLMSLKVYAHHWSFEDARTLAEGFVSSGRLRELNISVFHFEPELLTILAVNLPNLEVLTLDFHEVLPGGQVYDSSSRREIPRFCEEMGQLFFPQWRLRSLNIRPLNLGHSERASCKAALVEALPNVDVFCGLGRKEYLSTQAFV